MWGLQQNNAVKAEREAVVPSLELDFTLDVSDTALNAYSKTKLLQEDILMEDIEWKAVPLYSTLDSLLQKRLFKH